MAHVARGLVGCAQRDHLVIGPQRAVHQHAVCCLHGGPHRGLHPAQPRRVKQALAAGDIRQGHAHVVTRLRAVAVRRIGRCVADQWQGLQAQARHLGHAKAGAAQRHLVPVDAAIVLQDFEQRIAAHQVVTHQCMAPQLQWLAVLAQHVEASAVVDLGVDQKHSLDGGVAQGTGRLQGGERFDLLQDVGRGVEQHPGFLVGSDGDG